MIPECNVEGTVECMVTAFLKQFVCTVRTGKQGNRKTTLYFYFSVFDGVIKQIILQDTY